MEPVNGMHLGLVVSDTPDPDNRNRIQVWIPYLSSTLYGSVNAKLKNLSFKGPGDLNTIDSDILTTLRKILPWAEYAAPLFGGSGGLYNGSTGATATNSGSTLQADPNPSPKGSIPFPSLNSEGKKPFIPEPPIGATPISIRTTHYSTGTDIGGPDPSSVFSKDPNTNLGNSAIGKNLGVGIVGSTIKGITFGDVLQRTNPITGRTEIYYVSDTAESPKSRNRIDIYTSPTNWQSPDSAWSLAKKEPDFQNWTKLGNIGKIRSYDQIRAKLQDYTQYGEIPPYESTQQWLASKGNSTTTEVASTASSKNPVQIPNITAGSGFVAGNTGFAGSAVGSFTTPNAGSKVWVFFLGGDIQRPVYFAQAPSPGDIAAS